jgi:predicted enzyme related to lactoylglutathione lyase
MPRLVYPTLSVTRATAHHGSILKPIQPDGDLLLATLHDPSSNTLGLWQFTQI